MNAEQLGRQMMIQSGDLKDDRESNDWARIGQVLTQLGAPMMPKSVRELPARDKEIITNAIRKLQDRHS